MNLTIIDPLYYLKTLRDIGRFALHPVKPINENKNISAKITDLFVILFLTLFFSLSAFFLNIHFFHPVPTSGIFDLQQKLGPLYFFLFSVFLIPFIEESMFRLPLKYSAHFLSISFFFFAFEIISKLLFHSKMYESSFLISRISLTIISALLFYIIVRFKKIDEKLQIFWSTHFLWIFWILTLSFAWTHILNYKSYPAAPFLTPILTLPQFFVGLSSAYLRMNYGFVYAVLLHGLYNSSPSWLPF